MPVTQEKRRRVDELHSADFQWMRELRKNMLDGGPRDESALECVVSIQTAGQRNKKLGQGPTADEERTHGALNAPRQMKKDLEGSRTWHLEEIQSSRTGANADTVGGDCGYTFGAHMEDGRRPAGRGGSLRGRGVPGGGLGDRSGGDFRVFELTVVPSSGDFFLLARKMGTVEPGCQECVSSGGRLRS